MNAFRPLPRIRLPLIVLNNSIASGVLRILTSHPDTVRMSPAGVTMPSQPIAIRLP